jgi:4-diphosphocytidyl-2-C-methyl-D-erythritol kinase
MGLGGGSSDGAAVLKILNSYFKNKVSKVELQKLASEIGKDVPVFLSSKDAVFLDRMGDRIRKEVGFRKFNFLLVNPGIYVSTPWAFNEIHKCGNLGNKKKSVRMLKYLEKKNFGAIISGLHNDFEMAMEKKYPIISELKKKLIEFGASGSLMSGSGSTVFGIFENQKKLLEAEKMMKKNYPKFFVKIG